MNSQTTLSSRLDGHQSEDMRMEALAELAQVGQIRVIAFLRKRGITDGDVLADLSGDVWCLVTSFVVDGRYIDCGKDAMAFVYRVTHNILRHYIGRDRRLRGQIITLDESTEQTMLSDSDPLGNLEEEIDRAYLYQEMIDRLQSEGDRNIAHLCWQDQSAPQIAAQLHLNIKTVRAGLRRIAEEVRTLRELSNV